MSRRQRGLAFGGIGEVGERPVGECGGVCKRDGESGEGEEGVCYDSRDPYFLFSPL